MTFSASATLGAYTFLHLEFVRASGAGPELPRIHATLHARTPVPAMGCDELHLHGRLKLGSRLLGIGSVSRADFRDVDQQLELIIPLGREAMAALVAHQVADTVEVALDLSGTMTVRHEGGPEVAGVYMPMAEGVPRSATVQVTDLRLTIARSDWYKTVLQPTGVAQFILMEVKVPLDGLGEGYRKAVSLVSEADRAWVLATCQAPSSGVVAPWRP